MSFDKKDFSKVANFAGKYKYAIAVIAVGILLLGFPSSKENPSETSFVDTVNFDIDAFENRIEKALTECEGVGKVNVILSVESGLEKVYAKEEKQSIRKSDDATNESDSDMRPSKISEGAGREVPLLVKEKYPKFRGAAVICTGADKLEVQKNIIEVVGALTGLSSDRISVAKMK